MIIPIIKLLGVVPQNGIAPHYLCAMNQLKQYNYGTLEDFSKEQRQRRM